MADLDSLDGPVTAIEERLHALGSALRDRDMRAIDTHASELQRALAVAVQRFAQAARTPEGVPPALRQRLVRASGLVAAQRESLARATAALDRAIDVLMPGEMPPSVYGQGGHAARAASRAQAAA